MNPTAAHPPDRTAEATHLLSRLGEFDLIIDARTPREYADDHIAGAINLPVVSDREFAEVGTQYQADPHAAYVIGAQYALRNIADHVQALSPRLTPNTRVLVYCARGGKRSQAWAAPLRTMGIDTAVLPGGWRAYRRVVLADIDALVERLRFVVLAGGTGSGKTQLLAELSRLGEQALDLEALACHRGSLLGALPDASQPTQKRFEGALWARLQSFDAQSVVWIEDESRKIGSVHLPARLVETIRSAPVIEIDAPREARVALLMAEYAHLTQDPEQVITTLQPLVPRVGRTVVAEWEALAKHGHIAPLVDALLAHHYDLAYAKGAAEWRQRRPVRATVRVPRLDADALRETARRIVSIVQGDAHPV